MRWVDTRYATETQRWHWWLPIRSSRQFFSRKVWHWFVLRCSFSVTVILFLLDPLCPLAKARCDASQRAGSDFVRNKLTISGSFSNNFICLFRPLKAATIIFIIDSAINFDRSINHFVYKMAPPTKATSSNVFFCPTKSPNSKDIQFTIMSGEWKNPIQSNISQIPLYMGKVWNSV